MMSRESPAPRTVLRSKRSSVFSPPPVVLRRFSRVRQEAAWNGVQACRVQTPAAGSSQSGSLAPPCFDLSSLRQRAHWRLPSRSAALNIGSLLTLPVPNHQITQLPMQLRVGHRATDRNQGAGGVMGVCSR